MVSAPTWCLVSNRFGRRTILLTGLLGSAISIILFGLSKSLIWAVIARSLGGLLNGNLPIARTYVGELAAITGADLGKVFSVFGFSLALGWIGKLNSFHLRFDHWPPLIDIAL
jgi:MFS family permease